jgi:hypothetical protein
MQLAADTRARTSSLAGDPAERDLDRVLVLTARKSFWASHESEIFPQRVFTPSVKGHSTSVVNTILLAMRALLVIARTRPRLLLFGSAHRLVPVFLLLRRYKLLRRTGIVATNQVFFGPRLGRYADRVIVYSRRETEHRENYVYVPIPADGDFASVRPHRETIPYVFSGGWTLRDFAALFAAVDGTGIPLTVVTHSPDTLGVEGAPPAECRVYWNMPLGQFLSHLAGSLFVVVPLKATDAPHGHTTIAQALSLGKAVVTTRGAGVADYVRDGIEGLLVDPGDVEGYRAALIRLAQDEELRSRCEQQARARANEFTYASFAGSVTALCAEVMRERGS